MSKHLDRRKEWLTFYVICLGVLMMVLDATIVTVALPSISADLNIAGPSLTWTLNAYMLTLGGFLLLSGRLADLYGQRRLFLVGINVFTLTSLACGLSQTQTPLVAARALQGIGGALVTAVSLSLIASLFSAPGDRARAMGIYGLVCAAGGGVGEVLGGLLTKTLNWHWIFYVNVPIGIVVYAFCARLLPQDIRSHEARQLDIAGAVSITIALTALIYAVVNCSQAGWVSSETTGPLGLSCLLLLTFLNIESRVRRPLVPLRIFRLRNVAAANVVVILWSTGTFAWLVISALYLQHILSYDPFRVGLAFVPSEMIMAIFSAGLSAKMVMRFGTRRPLCIGLLLAAVGLALFARAPIDGTFVVDVLPGMALLGIGAGMASPPLLLIAMSDINSKESGLASGIVNTSFMMGGAFGLALLATLADVRTRELRKSGAEAVAALNGGYHLAFLVGAMLTAAGAVFGALALRPGPQQIGTSKSVAVSVTR